MPPSSPTSMSTNVLSAHVPVMAQPKEAMQKRVLTLVEATRVLFEQSIDPVDRTGKESQPHIVQGFPGHHNAFVHPNRVARTILNMQPDSDERRDAYAGLQRQIQIRSRGAMELAPDDGTFQHDPLLKYDTTLPDSVL